MLFVLDVVAQDIEPVDLGRERRGDRTHRPVALFRQLLRRAGRVRVDDGREAKRAERVAALRERVHMAVDRAEVADLRALHAEKLVVHPQEMLADDMQAGIRQQVMDVRHPTGDRVLDRDHGEPRLALVHGGEHVLEGRAGQ